VITGNSWWQANRVEDGLDIWLIMGYTSNLLMGETWAALVRLSGTLDQVAKVRPLRFSGSSDEWEERFLPIGLEPR
jgi:hypothetical protein